MARRKKAVPPSVRKEKFRKASLPKPTDNVYQLKITLEGTEPPIWRRILVPDCTVQELHRVIQVAMGWEDDHLYEFDFGRQTISARPEGWDRTLGEAGEARLSAMIPGARFSFGYEYDFGDSWEHEIEVEQILTREPGQHYPVCLAGGRACPPEDCGGVWGYADILEALKAPESDRKEELLEWLGEYNPEAFDRDRVNERFAKWEM